MPKYYPINEEAAKRAKDMNSFSDYQPGSATAGYRAMVDEAYAAAERQKARVDPMYHDKIDALVDRYARKLAENLNERNVIDARVPSILISGGGNFPVAKKHKQNAARDRNYGEYAEISKLLDKIRSVGMGGISADAVSYTHLDVYKRQILVFYQKSPVYNPKFTYGKPYARVHSRSGTSSNLSLIHI